MRRRGEVSTAEMKTGVLSPCDFVRPESPTQTPSPTSHHNPQPLLDSFFIVSWVPLTIRDSFCTVGWVQQCLQKRHLQRVQHKHHRIEWPPIRFFRAFCQVAAAMVRAGALDLGRYHWRRPLYEPTSPTRQHLQRVHHKHHVQRVHHKHHLQQATTNTITLTSSVRNWKLFPDLKRLLLAFFKFAAYLSYICYVFIMFIKKF